MLNQLARLRRDPRVGAVAISCHDRKLAGQCYRFVLSNPHVDVCLMAPSNARQLAANLEAVRLGPLPEDELTLLREYGDAVHRNTGWFMQPKHDRERRPPAEA